MSWEQATADLRSLGELVKSRKREQAEELEAMHRRYLEAAPPREGEHQSLAYRLRLLLLDRWNLWPRLTRYRHWKGPKKETLDGTNNACERAIGWWIKERYRSMRGYKVPENAVGSAVCWPGVATSSAVSREPIWRGCYSKPGPSGNLRALPPLISGYQLSNDHIIRKRKRIGRFSQREGLRRYIERAGVQTPPEQQPRPPYNQDSRSPTRS